MHPAKIHLLVDGHNVLHAWGWIALGEPVARARLIGELQILSSDDREVTLVFDGHGEVGESDAAVSAPGFRVVYASLAKTADGAIERLAAGDAEPRRCVVATSDATVRGNVIAAGGETITPDELRAWVERARERARRAIAHRRATQPDRFGNKLPL